MGTGSGPVHSPGRRVLIPVERGELGHVGRLDGGSIAFGPRAEPRGLWVVERVDVRPVQVRALRVGT